jgi:hypothetical protein
MEEYRNTIDKCYDMLGPYHPHYFRPFGDILRDTIKLSMFIFGAIGLACSCFQSVKKFGPTKNMRDFFDNFSRVILEIMTGGFIGFYWPVTAPAWLGYRYLTNSLSTSE